MKNSKTVFYGIGIMSGTSIDGLDICYCSFNIKDKKVDSEIICAQTIVYPEEWKQKLSLAHTLKNPDFLLLHNQYGRYIGQCVHEFCEKNQAKPDFISSHGHTVFHDPAAGLTFQIGQGAEIFAKTGIPVVCDFRTLDVALKGQGAPLVPVGDFGLFPDFRSFLNLGGFSNISLISDKRIIGSDICPVNIVLNHYAHKLGVPYDEDGKLSASGSVDLKLLEQLNIHKFYRDFPRHSLGREWVEQHIFPLLESYEIAEVHKMRTFIEHISVQISHVVNSYSEGDVLVTGGGAYNTFLINSIQGKSKIKLIVPERNIVEFKEALIFAYLGLLRFLGRNNILAEVTGAVQNSSSGIIWGS